MIFIVVSCQVKPGFASEWMGHVTRLTAATRAEAGNRWLEWSRSVENPNQCILIGAFDDNADEARVNPEHFAKDLEAMKPLLAETPRIALQVLPDRQDWDRMGELQAD